MQTNAVDHVETNLTGVRPYVRKVDLLPFSIGRTQVELTIGTCMTGANDNDDEKVFDLTDTTPLGRLGRTVETTRVSHVINDRTIVMRATYGQLRDFAQRLLTALDENEDAVHALAGHRPAGLHGA